MERGVTSGAGDSREYLNQTHPHDLSYVNLLGLFKWREEWTLTEEVEQPTASLKTRPKKHDPNLTF